MALPPFVCPKRWHGKGLPATPVEPWESMRVRADELAETSDGRVFARLSLTGRGKASGAVTEQRAWTVLWFVKGLCTRRRVFRDRDEALEAAGLSD